jgi:flagellar motor switch protein FliN/FliY
MALDPHVQKFAALLADIEEIMSRDVKTRWTDEVRRCRLAAENSDGWCIDRFLGFFGGMGSLNDYYIQSENGPDINATDKLNSLFSEAWTLARALKKAG